MALRSAAALLLAAAALSPAAARGQGPEADWRTIETAHFRIHFEAPVEAWATRLATRLEELRLRVAVEVGYQPPQTVDVLVADPEALANGSAWALLDAPRIVLWTTPPEAASTLGHLDDWGELVAVHELAHLAHLLRPSRAPWRARLGRTLVPIGPLVTGTPRWAIEGYATLVEGRVTGSGRPTAALTAAVLRQWARQGRLPSYAGLSRDRDRFLGGSMAYLAGSAFLEWLERRAGAGALEALWVAGSARADRGFDAAFERVFGDRPAALWTRFVAETTAAAIASESAASSLGRPGELWLDRDGGTSDLALAADGSRLAALLADRRRPTRLVVWDLTQGPAADPDAESAEADPEDPPAVSRAPRERAAAATLEPESGSILVGARFLRTGTSLLVSLVAPDRRGRRRADLALWRPEDGAFVRLTRGADLREADPLPDGRSAIAVRWRDGASGLVRVDLDRGTVEELGAASVEIIHDRPRVAPDGSALAWLEHRDGRWRPRVASIDAGGALGPARRLDVDGETVDLAWRHDGSLLYAAVARGGAIEIEALAVTSAARSHRVTHADGAALAPAPLPTGSALYYLALDADGFDIRLLPLDAAIEQATTATAAVEAEAATPRPRLEPATVAPARAYGAGRAEWRPLLGGTAGAGSNSFELGVRAGDLLGRWQLVALAGGGGDSAPRGGAVRLTVRRAAAPVELRIARIELPQGPAISALELAVADQRHLGPVRIAGSLGVGAARHEPATHGGDPELRGIGQVDLALERAWRSGSSALVPVLGVRATRGFADSAASTIDLELALAGRFRGLGFELAARRLEARGSLADGELPSIGGAPSSIVPYVARPARIARPGLPEGARSGRELESLSLRLSTEAVPVALFVERHRADAGEWLDLLGAELTFALESLPLLGLPAFEASAGLALADGEPFENDLRAWAALSFPLGPGRAGNWLGGAARR